MRGGTTTGGGAAAPRPRASMARATATGLVTGGGMTATPAVGASLCAAVEWQRSSVTVMTSAVLGTWSLVGDEPGEINMIPDSRYQKSIPLT